MITTWGHAFYSSDIIHTSNGRCWKCDCSSRFFKSLLRTHWTRWNIWYWLYYALKSLKLITYWRICFHYPTANQMLIWCFLSKRVCLKCTRDNQFAKILFFPDLSQFLTYRRHCTKVKGQPSKIQIKVRCGGKRNKMSFHLLALPFHQLLHTPVFPVPGATLPSFHITRAS